MAVANSSSDSILSAAGEQHSLILIVEVIAFWNRLLGRGAAGLSVVIKSLDIFSRFRTADFRYWYCGWPQSHRAIEDCREVFFHEHGFHPVVLSLLSSAGSTSSDQ